jgi:hypothetical protein
MRDALTNAVRTMPTHLEQAQRQRMKKKGRPQGSGQVQGGNAQEGQRHREAMPHRNNIAGWSLRRNRKSLLTPGKKRRKPGISSRTDGAENAAFLCGAATKVTQSG